jgi:uncharacterized protein (DUF1499 family)
MTDTAIAEPRWTRRMSKWALWLGVVALGLTIGGALLARFDIVGKLMGLNMMFGGALLSIVGTLVALIALVLNLRTKAGLMTTAALGLLLSGGHAGFMVSRAANASKVPSIHDVTTNLADPPAFTKLKLSADNLRGVETADKWKALHSGAYGDIKPLTLDQPVAAVIAKAEALAKERGWVVALADPTAGQLEATASVSLIAFQDDVILRARATEDGKGSVVDMRSVSRVGISDLGVNAKRVREFLAALSAK